jgi:hypothetical protein
LMSAIAIDTMAISETDETIAVSCGHEDEMRIPSQALPTNSAD